MTDIFSTPVETRGPQWERDFFKILLAEPVYVLASEPQEGPEGFPYLMVSMTQPAEAVGAVEDKFENIAGWCSSRGIGIVVNPEKETPDYIFTYGMLWNLALRGELLTSSENRKSGNLNIVDGQAMLAGQPSEDYWPTPVRKIFKEFLLQQGILEMKTILLFEKKDGPADFCFSLESLGRPPQSEWDGILEAFSWFFPRHYSLSLISEKTFKTPFAVL